ncbi:MAG TPA: ABC transporter ATP-binding protein [Rickettsiales bacterium]|nr:ABC transporter ATP-binding protein [Rickettsiales bacterium]
MTNSISKVRTLPFLWGFVKKYKWNLFTVISIIVIGDQIFLIGANTVLKNFINKVNQGDINIKSGLFYGCLYLTTINFLNMLFPLVRKIKFPVMFKLKEDIKNFVFNHSLKQSNSFFSENFVGSLNSKINDITNGAESIVEKSFDIISNFLGFIMVSFVFLGIYWLLGTVFSSLFIIYCVLFYFLSMKIEKLSEESSKKENECSGKIIDCFANILNIKIFSTQKSEKANIKKQTLKILKSKSEIEFYNGVLDVLNLVLRIILLATVFSINLYLLLNKKIEIGTMVTNLSMSLSMIWWLHFAMMSLIKSIDSYGKVNQAVQTLFINPEIVDSKTAKKLIVDKAEIEFIDVNFKYKENLPLIFEDFNLKIGSHQKMGLVGYTGSGKSSLISLLLRFYDVNSGGILIDNQDIKTEVTQESLRQNISYIPQDPILFHRTIRENIAYGRPNATDEEIIEASKKACCYDFINDLENKYDTLVGERGVKLSGGQRQRIAIARAILKNSPILILDEATSALDSITEKEIQIALRNLMENKTVIAVAHRLSTLDNMDRIVVLDKGKIVEDGTKDELLSIRGGLFKKMWSMQKDGVIGDETNSA